MKKILILFGFCILLTGCFSTEGSFEEEEKKEEMYKTITVEEVKKITDNYSKHLDTDIIDLRDEEDFAKGHIVGAMNIPLIYIDEIIISADQRIILYCDSSFCNEQAVEILHELGYEKVFVMGNIDSWPYELVDY